MIPWKTIGLALGLLATPLMGEEGGKPANIQRVGFTYASPQSKVEIVFDQEVTFEKNVSEADKQVIIDIPNAKIAKKWARRIDASQFKSNVAMISPYQSENRVRITLQLKENAGVEISQDGKTIVALIDNKQPKTEVAESSDPKSSNNDEEDPSADDAKPSTVEVPAAATPNEKNESITVSGESASPASNDSLDQFAKAQQTHQYSGKRIWLQAQDMDLADVFRIISEASEFNIVLSESVRGKAILNLTDLPWDQALDLVLRSYGLAAERRGNVLRIMKMEEFVKEREAELAAQKVQDAAEPIVVKIFPISYAKPESLQTIIQSFLSKDQAAGGAVRGSIQVDSRTNSLILRDTPSNIEKIKRIVKELDTATPQILIEGKFVEVSETNSKSISGRLFGTTREYDSTAKTFNFTPANNNFGAAFNTQGPEAFSPTSFAGQAGQTGGMGFGFMPKAALLPGIGEIGAFISILEAESLARVVASPRVVTQNKESASITQGQKLTILGTVSNGVVSPTTSIDMTLSLNVTPQVTNDGSVLVKIAFTQSTPAPAGNGQIATSSKSIDTNVIVESGGTIVIGGVYGSSETNMETGIPILRNLPIIGPLFGSKQKSTSKAELFIFLTPRVLNEKEAGTRG